MDTGKGLDRHRKMTKRPSRCAFCFGRYPVLGKSWHTHAKKAAAPLSGAAAFCMGNGFFQASVHAALSGKSGSLRGTSFIRCESSHAGCHLSPVWLKTGMFSEKKIVQPMHPVYDRAGLSRQYDMTAGITRGSVPVTDGRTDV